MPKTYQQAIAWFEAGPARAVNDGNWDQGCEAAVSNGCGFSPYTSALAAAQHSGPLTGTPKPGMLGYASGAQGFGHVWLVAPDPAFGYMASARAAAMGRQLGHNLAYVNTAAYLSATGLPILGYSYRHGTEELTDYSFAGGGETPIAEDDDMTPEQDARLKNVEAILGGLQNGMNDPKVGTVVGSQAAQAAEVSAQNSANIASDVRNLIVDPNLGVLHAISQIKPVAGGTADLTPVLTAIQQLPAQIISALKEAL